MSVTNPSSDRGEPFERRSSASEPLVSVVVPVFNAERWLHESLFDLLGQTLRDAEFVFVDDGSTDGSVRLLEEAAARDPRVRVLRQDRKFAGCARNLGLDAARGKWFIALDADDRFELDLLEEAVRRGEETDAQIVLFDADGLAMPDGIRVPRPALARASKLPAGPFRPSEDTFEAFRVAATWNKLYRLDYVRENGFRYQETFECNDIRFVFLSMAKATRVAALPRVLLHYRVGLSDNVQSLKDEHPFDVVAAYASLRRELERAGLWERFRKVYVTRATISLTGSRFAGFRSVCAARAWYDRIRSSGLAELGLDDLADDDFVGPDAERLRARFRDFLSLPFDEWVWEALRQARRSNDRLRQGNSTVRESLREAKARIAGIQKKLAGTQGKLVGTQEKLVQTKAKLAEAKGKLVETKGKLVETKGKLAEAKTKLERAKAARDGLLRSFPFRLGMALTRPLRAAGAALFLGKRAVARALHPYRPKISVVVANRDYPVVTTAVLTYNHAPYVAQAIESALAQRGRLVHDNQVADNGSTDGTRDVVEGFARENPGRIRVVRNAENIGISGNFRKAISLARGKYVCLLEGDDYWCSDSKVGKQVEYLEANPDCSMVFSRTKTLKDGKTGLLKYQDRLPGKMRGEDFASIHDGGVIANFSSTMFRRDLIASLPDSLYEGRVSEVSIPFYLERFGPIGYIPEALSVYRIHSGGTFSGATRLERCRQKRMCRVQALSVCRPECRKALEEIVGRLDAELKGIGEVP